MCGFMFGMFTLKEAYINSPDEFIITFEIENKTQEVIKGLNGSIIINNYYGDYNDKQNINDILDKAFQKANDTNYVYHTNTISSNK